MAEESSNKKMSSPTKEMNNGDKDSLFHVIHKVPFGDGPYVRAKHAQVYFFLLYDF